MDSDRVPKHVTTPVTLNQETGAVAVKKSSGKVKIRRGQTQEEYLRQREQFWQNDVENCTGLDLGWRSHGGGGAPEVTDWTDKQERTKVLDHLTWLYYHGERKQCLKLIQTQVWNQFDTLNTIPPLRNKLKKEMGLLQCLLDQCSANE